MTSSFDRTKPPASKWLVAPGPLRKNSHRAARSTAASTSSTTAASTPAACRRAGCRPRGGPAGARRRRAGRAPARSRATAGARTPPTPDSCSSCGELIAPPHRMTSPASTRSMRRAPRVYSTPVARVPSNRTRCSERARDDVEVGPVHHRVQVGAGGAQPAAAVDVAVELGEALLLVAVDVVGERVAGLLGRLEERVEQRVGRPGHARAPAARRRRGTRPRRPGSVSIRLKYGRQWA